VGTVHLYRYDLTVDPGETNDIAESHPELLDELIKAWEEYAEEVGVVLAEN
jgi:hypothetical protein